MLDTAVMSFWRINKDSVSIRCIVWRHFKPSAAKCRSAVNFSRFLRKKMESQFWQQRPPVGRLFCWQQSANSRIWPVNEADRTVMSDVMWQMASAPQTFREADKLIKTTPRRRAVSFFPIASDWTTEHLPFSFIESLCLFCQSTDSCQPLSSRSWSQLVWRVNRSRSFLFLVLSVKYRIYCVFTDRCAWFCWTMESTPASSLCKATPQRKWPPKAYSNFCRYGLTTRDVWASEQARLAALSCCNKWPLHV